MQGSLINGPADGKVVTLLGTPDAISVPMLGLQYAVYHLHEEKRGGNRVYKFSHVERYEGGRFEKIDSGFYEEERGH